MRVLIIHDYLGKSMRMALRPLIFLTLYTLASCSYVPLGAVSALSGTDLLQVEAQELRVAIVSPDNIRFAGPPQLLLETVVPGRNKIFTRIMFVEEGKDNFKKAPMNDSTRRAQVYKADPAQAELWLEFQATIRAFKAAGVRGRVDASVDAKVCRGTPEMVSGEVDIYLKVAATKDYVRVLRDVPSSKLVTALYPKAEVAECL